MNLTAKMREVITLAPAAGITGAHAQPTYGTQVAVAARVERAQRYVLSGAGEEVLVSHTIYTVARQLQPFDLVWLPEADITKRQQARRVVTTDVERDLRGVVVFYVATLGAH